MAPPGSSSWVGAFDMAPARSTSHLRSPHPTVGSRSSFDDHMLNSSLSSRSVHSSLRLPERGGSLIRELDEQEHQIRGLNSQLSALQGEVQGLESSIHSLSGGTQTFPSPSQHMDEREELSARLSVQRRELRDKQEAIDAVLTRLERAHQTLDSLQSQRRSRFFGWQPVQSRRLGGMLRRSWDEADMLARDGRGMSRNRRSFEDTLDSRNPGSMMRRSLDESDFFRGSRQAGDSLSRVPQNHPHTRTLRRLKDMHYRLEEELSESREKVAELRGKHSARLDAIRAVDERYSNAAQGSEEWLRLADEGLHLRADAEEVRRELTQAEAENDDIANKLRNVHDAQRSLVSSRNLESSNSNIKDLLAGAGLFGEMNEMLDGFAAPEEYGSIRSRLDAVNRHAFAADRSVHEQIRKADELQIAIDARAQMLSQRLRNNQQQKAALQSELAQRQEQVRGMNAYIEGKRKSVYPADHAAADRATEQLQKQQQDADRVSQQLNALKAEEEQERNELRQVVSKLEGMVSSQQQEIDYLRSSAQRKRKSVYPQENQEALQEEAAAASKSQDIQALQAQLADLKGLVQTGFEQHTLNNQQMVEDLSAKIAAQEIEIQAARSFAASKRKSMVPADKFAAQNAENEAEQKDREILMLREQLLRAQQGQPVDASAMSLNMPASQELPLAQEDLMNFRAYVAQETARLASEDPSALQILHSQLQEKEANVARLEQMVSFAPDVPAQGFDANFQAQLQADILSKQEEVQRMQAFVQNKKMSIVPQDIAAVQRAQDEIFKREQDIQALNNQLAINSQYVAHLEQRIWDSTQQNIATQAEKESQLQQLQAKLEQREAEVESLQQWASSKRKSTFPSDILAANKADEAIQHKQQEISSIRRLTTQIMQTSTNENSLSELERLKNELAERDQLIAAKDLQLAEAHQSAGVEPMGISAEDLSLPISPTNVSDERSAALEMQMEALKEQVESLKVTERTKRKSMAPADLRLAAKAALKVAKKEKEIDELAKQLKEANAATNQQREAADARVTDLEKELEQQRQFNKQMEERMWEQSQEAEQMIASIKKEGLQHVHSMQAEIEELNQQVEDEKKKAEKLSQRAAHKRKSVHPGDIQEAEDLERQAQQAAAQASQLQKVASKRQSLVRFASESVLQSKGREEAELLQRLEQESKEVDSMRQWASNKRKSVLPADQTAAAKAEEKISDKENLVQNLLQQIAKQQEQISKLNETVNTHIVSSAPKPTDFISSEVDTIRSDIARAEQELMDVQQMQEEAVEALSTMEAFYNGKLQSGRAADHNAAVSLEVPLAQKREDIERLNVAMMNIQEYLRGARNALADAEGQAAHGMQSDPEIAARSAELHRTISKKEDDVEKLKKWQAHKRKSVLPGDQKAANKAQEKIDEQNAEIEALKLQLAESEKYASDMQDRIWQQEAHHMDHIEKVKYEERKKAQHEVDTLNEEIGNLSDSVKQMKKWAMQKRKSVLPGDQKAAEKVESMIQEKENELREKQSLHRTKSEILEKSIAADESSPKPGKKKRVVSFQEPGQEETEGQRPVRQYSGHSKGGSFDESNKSSVAKQRIKQLDEEIQSMKTWVARKRTSVYPADQSAADRTEKKIVAKEDELEKLKRELAETMTTQLSQVTNSLGSEISNLKDELEKARRERDEAVQARSDQAEQSTGTEENLQKAQKAVDQMKKFVLQKRKSVLPNDQKAADKAEQVIADKQKEIEEMKEQMAAGQDYIAAVEERARASEERMAQLEEQMAQMNNQMAQPTVEPMVANSHDLQMSAEIEQLMQERDAATQYAREMEERAWRQAQEAETAIKQARLEEQAKADMNASQLQTYILSLEQDIEKSRRWADNKRKSVFPNEQKEAAELDSRIHDMTEELADLKSRLPEAQRREADDKAETEKEVGELQSMIDDCQSNRRKSMMKLSSQEAEVDALQSQLEAEEEQFDQMKVWIAEKRKSRVPSDQKAAKKAEVSLDLKSQEISKLREQLQQGQQTANELRLQVQAQAEEHDRRIADMQHRIDMISGSGSLKIDDEDIDELSAEVRSMSEWIRQREASGNAAGLGAARRLLAEKQDEVERLRNLKATGTMQQAALPDSASDASGSSVDTGASGRSGRQRRGSIAMMCSAEKEELAGATLVRADKQASAKVMLERAHAELQFAVPPPALNGVQSPDFLSLSSLPNDVMQLKNIVIETRRMMADRDRGWQRRMEAMDLVANAQSEFMSIYEEALDRARMQRTEAVSALQRVRQRVKYLEQRTTRAEEEAAQASERVEKQKGKVRELVKRLSMQSGAVASLGQSNGDQLDKLRAKKSSYKSQVKDLENEVQDSHAKIVELENRLTGMRVEVEGHQQQVEERVEERDHLKSDIRFIDSTLQKSISRISQGIGHNRDGVLNLPQQLREAHPEACQEDGSLWNAHAPESAALQGRVDVLFHTLLQAAENADAHFMDRSQRAAGDAEYRVKQLQAELVRKNDALSQLDAELQDAAEAMEQLQTEAEEAVEAKDEEVKDLQDLVDSSRGALQDKETELQSVSKKLRIAEENVRVMKDWVQQRQAATVQQLEQVMGELEAERSNKNAQMAEWEETKEFMAEELNKMKATLDKRNERIAQMAWSAMAQRKVANTMGGAGAGAVGDDTPRPAVDMFSALMKKKSKLAERHAEAAASSSVLSTTSIE